MLTIQKNVFRVAGFALAALFALQSCNKSLEPINGPSPTPPATSNSINDIINNDTTYSILKAAVAKAGLGALISNTSGQFTLFAPNNAAFRLSGIPSEAALAAFRAGQLDTLLKFHIIPGRTLTTDSFYTTFPNRQMPSAFVLSAPFFRMGLFPTRVTGTPWVNNIPVVTPNIAASNGVIHNVAALLSPPTTVIAQQAATDTTLSFFMAAVAKADSGKTVDTDKFAYLLAYPPVNFTVFAPNNDAFRAFLVAQGLPPSATVINLLPAATVRGLLAYHILGVRAFPNNFPATETTASTLAVIGPGIPALTVKVKSTAGAISITDNKTLTSNVIAVKPQAINGYLYVIDRVLLPF